MRYLICVLCFIGFDIITGIIKALNNEGLNSTILRKGFFSKLSEILAVGLCLLLNIGADYIDLGFDIPLLQAVTVYICVMELVSILENLCTINPMLDKLFGPYLEKLKGVEKNDDEKDV